MSQLCFQMENHPIFQYPAELEQIKAEPGLRDIALLRQSRLSVMPLTASEAKILRKLGGLS